MVVAISLIKVIEMIVWKLIVRLKLKSISETNVATTACFRNLRPHDRSEGEYPHFYDNPPKQF